MLVMGTKRYISGPLIILYLVYTVCYLGNLARSGKRRLRQLAIRRTLPLDNFGSENLYI